MIARIVNVQGTQMGLLAAQPNWATQIKVTLELPTDVSKEAITFNESRRNFAQSARYSLAYQCYLNNAADATELRLFLSRIRSEMVAVPMWTDACETARAHGPGNTNILLVDLPARFGSTWIITTDDFSTFEFVTVQSLNTNNNMIAHLLVGLTHTYAAGCKMYPLLFGKFEERPKPEAITDEALDVGFKIKENSAFALRLSPTPVALPVVGSHIASFASTRKWDLIPNWSRPLDWTEMPDVVYEQVGFLRNEQSRVYDHRNARGQELEFYQAERASAGKIEYFWRDRRATTLRFFMPTFRGDLRMLYDTPVAGHPKNIRCEKSFFSNPAREAQPGDPFICVIDHNDSIDPYQLSNANDLPAETQLVATQNVAAHTAATSIVSHFVLSRFSEPKLEWAYTTPYLASTRIKFQELPHEYQSTPPALPEPAYLFIFTEVGVRVDRFTSYENTIVVPSGIYQGTYTPAPFSFNAVKVGVRLDQEKLDFKSFQFSGNPLNKLWPFALDGILTLEIVEVNAVTPTSQTAQSRFFGDVWSVDSDYKATAIPFGNLFDRKFPRFLLSVSDNYVQFSPPTKITPTAFKILGNTSGAPDHNSQTLNVTSVQGHAQVADWFAGGWLDTGSGNILEHRGILHSVPGSGSLVVLTLDRPLLKAVAGQQVQMYPGYDGSIDQCDTKFNNRINFGGQPFIPDVNPGVKAMTPVQTTGGKKG
jgi:hypothetical protein